jgi:hypothetical protein
VKGLIVAGVGEVLVVRDLHATDGGGDGRSVVQGSRIE